MKSDKEKLLEFFENLTAEEITYLASNYQDIVALLEAMKRPHHPGNSELTA